MKNVIKFLSVVILFLSTTLSAQRTYVMFVNDNQLFIKSVDIEPDSGIIIKTDSTPMFEFYALNSKQVLGVEKKENSTDKTLAKYMDMDNGDTKISTRIKTKVNGNFVEYFYYRDCYITNYFVSPQNLEGSDWVLEIKDNTTLVKYTIKNFKIEKETL
jgi:hypothetical protein